MQTDALFRQGDLDAALTSAAHLLRARPTDPRARMSLIEMICFAGQWERADAQLRAALAVMPDAKLSISLLRQLVRADLARQQFHLEGRAPEFLSPPPEHVKLRLKASVELREGNADAAAELLAAAESVRPPLKAEENGEVGGDVRDLDDVLSGVFEVLTSTGKYFWVPLESVESVELTPPATRTDLLWRRAHMVVRDGGPDGVVYIPCLYTPLEPETDAAIRLGRATQWREIEAAPTPIVRGRGLRMLLMGEHERDILSLGSMRFETA
jgi:type VI secretion system protein ImpE